MQYPRDTIEIHGRPIVRTFINPSVGDRVIDESYDRYAFSILSGGTSLGISPITNDGNTPNEVLTTAQGLLSLHHLTHGVIVNLGWTISSFGGLVNVTVIESFAFRPRFLDRFAPLYQPNTPKRKRLTPTPVADYVLKQTKRKKV